MSDPADFTAKEAARRLRAGSLKPEALREACVARAAQHEARLHIYAHFAPEAVSRPPMPGPLHGLPLGIKDVFDTADMPSAYGSPIWHGHRPRADAAAIAWARASGAVVIGKTVTTEFAYRHPGPTANPHDPARTPGGSSSGSAAGVAAGYFPFALGTQTAGSVIRPAAYCGVVGFKPSFGTINRAGLKPLAESLDTIGVFARSVADCALLAGTLGARALGDPDRKPERAPRIGLCRSPSWPQAAPETVALLAEAATRLGRAGAHVEERELPADFGALAEAHPLVMNAEAARALAWELFTHPAKLSRALTERLTAGMASAPENLFTARATLRQCRAAFPAAIEGLDILLTPAAPGEAPLGLDFTGDPAFNYLWTSLHLPCVTVPAGKGPNGMPLGVQIVGRFDDDSATLAWAEWIRQAMG